MRPKFIEHSENKFYGRIYPALIFMFNVYILKNEYNSELYYGFTNDLQRRLSEHNNNGQWKIVYYEGYLAEDDARDRERKLKHYGQSRSHLRKRVQRSLLNKN